VLQATLLGVEVLVAAECVSLDIRIKRLRRLRME